MPGGSFRLTGRYEDRLVHTPGGWRFQRREYLVMFEEMPGVGEDAARARARGQLNTAAAASAQTQKGPAVRGNHRACA